MLAELAEGKGRFIDQLLNGAYMSCEMNSWVLSARAPEQQTFTSRLPRTDYRPRLRRIRSINGLGTLFFPQTIRQNQSRSILANA